MRYESATGAALSPQLAYQLVAEENFWADTAKDGENTLVRVGDHAVRSIDALWSGIASANRPEARLVGVVDDDAALERIADLSLEWFLLHELMHAQLGHLPLLGVAALVEIDDGSEEISTNTDRIRLEDHLLPKDMPKIRRCLELQADNEASDVMLGAFRNADWNEIRRTAAAIFAVMALIERENARRGAPGKTHPRASTRFFVLVAQLFQFWLYKDAQLEADGDQSWVRTAERPHTQDFRRYAKEVLEPVIDDAVKIALWAGAETFVADIRDRGNIFLDVYDAQFAPDLLEAEFRTAAAREWRELLPVNERIMAITGLRG